MLTQVGDRVRYIPMVADQPFTVVATSAKFFTQRYQLMPGYPLQRGAQLYLSYCRLVGATDEVLDQLRQFTDVTDEDRDMAKSKTGNTGAETPRPRRRRRRQQESGKSTSAAQLFRDLIMEGKLTDDEIFRQVQEEFGLDDNRRAYVAWYRNSLKKKGENPPEPK